MSHQGTYRHLGIQLWMGPVSENGELKFAWALRTHGSWLPISNYSTVSKATQTSQVKLLCLRIVNQYFPSVHFSLSLPPFIPLPLLTLASPFTEDVLCHWATSFPDTSHFYPLPPYSSCSQIGIPNYLTEVSLLEFLFLPFYWIYLSVLFHVNEECKCFLSALQGYWFLANYSAWFSPHRYSRGDSLQR